MLLSVQKEILSIPTANGHASCIARVNGETWLTWFGGTHEKHPDVDVYLARKTASGWTEPMRITAAEDTAHWNPVLQPLPDGAYLYFKVGATIPSWRTMRAKLNLQGKITEEPAELVAGDVGGRGPVRNKCLTLRNGLTLAPASIETEQPSAWKDSACAKDIISLPSDDPLLRWKPMIDISSDGGRSFERISVIPLRAAGTSDDLRLSPDKTTEGNAKPLFPCRVQRAGAIQPALWQSDDGKVHALMRSSEGCILRSDSEDGLTWSPACCTNLPNNNSGIDLIRLADGRILLCLNPVEDDWGARTPLWLYISKDGGDSFTPLVNLEMNEGEYSYPSLACEGNTVYLSYTWNRLSIAVWTIVLEP